MTSGTEKSANTFLGSLAFNNQLTTETTASGKLLNANKEWVYRNNDVIAKEVSILDLELYTVRIISGVAELTRIDQHPALQAIDRFNDSLSKSQGFYMTQSHRKLTGDAFWYIQGKAPNIEAIYTLDPTKVTVNLGDFTKGAKKLIKSYTYKDTVNGETVTITYEPEEIIHFKVPNPNNPYRGLGAVEAMGETIDLDNMTTDLSKQFFKRGAITNFVLTTDQRVSPEDKKRMRAEFRANYGGIKNAFKAMILGGGLKPQSIQMTNKDMEYSVQLEWYRDKIMVGFGNTKSAIGIVEDVNRANAEATLASWKRNTVKPEMQGIVDTLNEFFLPAFGSNLIFGFKDPVPEDRASQVDQATKLYSANIITQNEARNVAGYDDVEGGDEFRTDFSITNISNPEELPKSITNVDYKSVFRKMGLYKSLQESKEIKQKARAIAEKHVKSKKKQISNSFSNEQVKAYWQKVMKIADVNEEIFKGTVEQYTKTIVDQAESNLDNPESRKKSELVDKDQLLLEAEAQFTPVLTSIAVASGNEANHLMGLDTPYIPKTKRIEVSKELKKYIRLFATSMIETDVAIIAGILENGLKEGLGIPEISRQIQEKFYGKGREAKIQAERVARSEVIRASNLAINDAFEESGVVEGKQWLAELDGRTDEDCVALDGAIVSVSGNYDSAVKSRLGNEKASQLLSYTGSMPYPPLHPNCRCTLIPVIEGVKTFEINKIQALEEQIDKRTKEFKELEKKNLEKDEYIIELEKLVANE